MKFKRQHFCCSPKLLRNIDEMHEIEEAIANVAWSAQFRIEVEGRIYEHQSGYNRALAEELRNRGWTLQPKLCTEPRLIGDASKNDVFVEVQFGNSSTLYRDYYKFHYGLMHGLLSFAVLIVPTTPTAFFPTRPDSIANMAEYDLACRCYQILPIPVPILVIGLLSRELAMAGTVRANNQRLARSMRRARSIRRFRRVRLSGHIKSKYCLF